MRSWLHAAVEAFLHPGGWYLFVRLVTASFAVSAIGRLIPVRRKQIAGYRGAPKRTVAFSAVGVAALLAVATWAWTAPQQQPASLSGLGVFEKNEWDTWQPVDQFASAVGHNPGIVLLYSGWNEPWQDNFAAMAYAHGAKPFVQLEPDGVSMQSIIDGHSDAYLRSYAQSVRLYQHPVILSFAAEMNGDWYAWGRGRTKPSVYVAAWQHVVDVFRQAGADNVTWLWDVNTIDASSAPLKQWWPGSEYVDLVGIDGYFYRSTDTYKSVFGTTVAQIRTFTSTPILVAETAVGPGSWRTGTIKSLFAGISKDRLVGLVWFDQAQHDGIYHQDWRLEDSASALAAFKKAVNHWSAKPGH